MADLFGKEIKDHLKEIFKEEEGWASTDDLVQALDRRNAWGDTITDVVIAWKKEKVRRLTKELMDEGGERTVQSIVMRDDDGEEVRVYKQESLFDVDDYRQVCAYYQGRVEYFRKELKRLRSNCRKRFDVDPLAVAPIA